MAKNNKSTQDKVRSPIQPDMTFKIDIATQTLERNIGFITSCDNKTSIVLASIGVLLTIILTNDGLKKIYSIIKTCVKQSTADCILYLAFLLIAVGVMVYGMFCLVSVLIAKTSEKANGCANADSHIFFTGIKKCSNQQSFHNGFIALSEQELLKELTAQIYINADIASIKYEKYNKGLVYSVIGFVLFVIVLLVGVYLY